MAAEFSSAARVFHTEAAPIIDIEPGPAYISPELTSGGKAPKSSITTPLTSCDRVSGLSGRIRSRAEIQCVDKRLVNRHRPRTDLLIQLSVGCKLGRGQYRHVV